MKGTTPPWLIWLRAFIPAPIAVDTKERWRATLGALAGVLFTASISRWLADTPMVGAWLVAPLGASAVLVFAAPASPLSQPWPVLAGNSVSALIGIACSTWIPDLVAAGAVAVALAIATMFALRCLHPPGGAMALSAVLLHASHDHLAVGAILVTSLLLIGVGVVYNSLTGRRYPHAQVRPSASEPGLGARFKSADLDAVLDRYNQVLDVSRDDLEALLLAAELEGYRRRIGEIRCKDVMSRDIVSVEFGSTLQEAWDLMKAGRIKALPVTDRARRIVGIVTMADFMRAAGIDRHHGFGAKLREFILPGGSVHSDKPEVVGQIMTRQVRVVGQDRHAVELMPIFTEASHHHIPIIDEENRLVGIITQSDFVRALYQGGYA